MTHSYKRTTNDGEPPDIHDQCLGKTNAHEHPDTNYRTTTRKSTVLRRPANRLLQEANAMRT